MNAALETAADAAAREAIMARLINALADPTPQGSVEAKTGGVASKIDTPSVFEPAQLTTGTAVQDVVAPALGAPLPGKGHPP